MIWHSRVCYNVSITDSVYYNKLCIADTLIFLAFKWIKCINKNEIYTALNNS